MKILIVEDEPLAAEKLANTVQAIEKEAEIIGCTGSIKATVAWLQHEQSPDLILMDIELSDGQSFEIFNQVEVESMVIFTTSYDEYALKAFKVNSIDYLLKPVQKEDLRKAFEKYKKHFTGQSLKGSSAGVLNIQNLMEQMQQQLQPKQYRKRFLVKHVQKQVPIEVEEIAYFFVQERVIFFKTTDTRKFILDYSMDQLEGMLDPEQFFRINRSFIVSIKCILQVHDYFNSRLLLTLQPSIDMHVIVSRDKVNAFKGWIGK
jgi:DNA-binding LytR/AlgR family response regulator